MKKEKEKVSANDSVKLDESYPTKINWISFACLLIITLIGIVIIMLNNISKDINSLLYFIENGEYNRVVEVFHEEEKTPSDYIPLYDVISTTESETKNDDTTTSNNETTTKKTYVINNSSKKIHLQTCSFVSRMNEENKTIVQLVPEELQNYINDGYTLCSTCGG